MQQMNPRDSLHEEQSYSGYQAERDYYQQPPLDRGTGIYPQSNMKIQPDTIARASAGQRMALAIVSVAIIGVVGISIGTDTTAGFMAYVGLTIVSLTIALINAFFNRWGAS